MELLLNLCDQLRENGHRALIFSQFTRHLALVREGLDQRDCTYAYLDGGTSSKMRQKQVETFQRGSLDFFLISLKAGGVGITLTAADFVIHLDPWWNPAVEDQATDRVYRIGQTKPVTVYRLVSRGTVEEKILNLHRRKRELADSLLSVQTELGGLDQKTLLSMMR